MPLLLMAGFLLAIQFSFRDSAFPQTYLFDHYNISSGLPSNWVTTICQDSKGYLWVGGDGGIAVHNGVSFTPYGADEGLPVPMTWKLAASRRPGTVFIGTYGGGRWGMRTSGLRKFEDGRISPVSMKESEPPHTVFEILEDRHGTIWFGTGQGVYRVQDTSAVSFPTGSDSGTVHILHESRDGSLLIGFANAFYRYTTSEGKAEGHLQRIDFASPSLAVNCLVEDNRGTLWLGTEGGKVLRMEGDKVTGMRKTPVEHLSSATIDRDGNLWFGSPEGLIKVPTKGFEQAKILHYTTENGLLSNDITACFIDREDNLWLGGRSTGLTKLAYRNIVKLQIENLHPHVFSRGAVADARGHLFTVTEEAIWEIWKDENSNWRSFAHPIRHITRTPTRPDQLVGGMSLDVARDGQLWVGFLWGGLRSYRISHRPGGHSVLTPVNTLRPGRELPAGSSSGILIDSENLLWYNMRRGPLVRLDLNTLKVRDEYRLSPGTLQAMLTAQDDTVWVGSFSEGIFLLAPQGDSYKLARQLTTENGLASNRVRSIIQRRNGDIWIGTRFDGISIYRNGRFRSLTTRNGLLNNAVWKLAEDEQGRVWVGTSVGIQYTDPDKDTLFTHPRLSGRQVGGIGIVEGKHTMWVLSEGELAIYEYGSDQRERIPPLIDVVGMHVNGISRNFGDELVLSHKENFCVIRYTGLSFKDEVGVQHRYRLLGLDTIWSPPTNERAVTFGSLGSGTYTFEVEAIAADGMRSEAPATLSFTILPPWYLSPWSIGLYVVFGTLFVFLYTKIRTRNLERRSHELERTVAERTAEVVAQRNRLHEQAEKLLELDLQKSHFFANISHEFRTPLTVILGHLDRLMKKEGVEQAKDYSIMDRNARRLLQFINQLLDLSKLEAGGMTLRAVQTDVVAFVKRTAAALSSYAQHKGIILTFNGVPPDAAGHTPVFAHFDHDKIEKVLINLLSNALKFTPHGGKVDFVLSSGHAIDGIQHVEIAVSDTGPGIPAAKLPYVFDRFYQVEDYARPGYEGTGIGLALVKELVELHHGSVAVHSTEGKGSTFTILLPLGTAHLDEGEIVSAESTRTAQELRVLPDLDSPIPEEPVAKDGDDARVLIVEDNADLRNLLREHLTRDYTVLQAADGKDGLRKAEDYMPDIIVSDIMMPGMDGYELCRTVKTNEKTNHIPVILLTAKATTENKLEGLQLGADDYLMKPFNPQELQIRVRNLIQLRKQLREKFSSEMLLKPTEVTVPSQQKVFLERISAAIESHLAEENFSVEGLAAEVGMSRSQLHRKLKALTNKGPNELIRSFRLQRAAELIRQDAGSLAEIAYQVGFGSQAHFTRSFSEEFGFNPSEFRKRNA